MSAAEKHRVNISSCGAVATVEQKRILRRAVKDTLKSEKIEVPCVVEVETTDDEGIHRINRMHRGVDKPTDVLSFPMQELSPGQQPRQEPWDMDEDGRVMLGEMLISLQRAEEQAREYGHSTERELAFLAVHSTLHLLGYDHERGEVSEKLQFSRQEDILNGMGITREI